MVLYLECLELVPFRGCLGFQGLVLCLGCLEFRALVLFPECLVLVLILECRE